MAAREIHVIKNASGELVFQENGPINGVKAGKGKDRFLFTNLTSVEVLIKQDDDDFLTQDDATPEAELTLAPNEVQQEHHTLPMSGATSKKPVMRICRIAQPGKSLKALKKKHKGHGPPGGQTIEIIVTG